MKKKIEKIKRVKAWAICGGNEINDNGFYLSIVKFEQGKKGTQQEIDKGWMDKNLKVVPCQITFPTQNKRK